VGRDDPFARLHDRGVGGRERRGRALGFLDRDRSARHERSETRLLLARELGLGERAGAA
jgi:hypothetical protein